MKPIKKEQQSINNWMLENQKNIEEIQKQLQSLKIESNDCRNKIEENEVATKNFENNIIFWSKQNEKIETKIVNSEDKVFEFKKQKINKIKNFFIKIFSFGKINKNKNIDNLIKVENTNYEALNKIKFDNQIKINNLDLDKTKFQNEKTTLIMNLNKILEKENQLLIELNICLNKYQENKFIKEINEKMIEEHELETFELRERICDLENQLLSNSSDEGFNSKSTSTDSLNSSTYLSSKKQSKLQTPKSNKPQERVKPWEQTLREYDYPTKKCNPKNKINLLKI